jgi:hypothetical protein
LPSVVGLLVAFTELSWVSPDKMKTVIHQELLQVIRDHDDDQLADTVHELVGGLNDKDGIVPQTKDELVELVDETVASQLMTQVFGSTEFFVGLHARKILIALDMYDWEESGATCKEDVKMSTISAAHVKKSLRTWMPKGTGKDFHDMMESVGTIISAKRQGEWGKIKTVINTCYPYTEKKCVLEMVESISQFYKATKSKKGKRPSPAANPTD